MQMILPSETQSHDWATPTFHQRREPCRRVQGCTCATRFGAAGPTNPIYAWKMDFALDERQQDVQRRARAFASQIAPKASALDRAGSIPPDIIAGAA